jgi:hypothetical protein
MENREGFRCPREREVPEHNGVQGEPGTGDHQDAPVVVVLPFETAQWQGDVANVWF